MNTSILHLRSSAFVCLAAGLVQLSAFSPQAAKAQTLTEALNATNLVWSTGGDVGWLAQATNTHDGFLAAQSGTITHSQKSWLETTVSGPGVLSFSWKVSSESGCDYLEFYTNGLRATRISGTVDWQRLNYTLGSGNQALHWRFSKDSSVSFGQDRGWLDEVSYEPQPTSGPPVLLIQPLSLTNFAGTTARYLILAGGEFPLAYQWRKDGTNLLEGASASGTTASTLTLSGVLGANTGGYSVVVSNASGSVTSAVAGLTVIDPVISQQPTSQTVSGGTKASFSVSAAGTPMLTYQWRKAGTNLAGATTTSLVLTNVQGVDVGNYDVVVGNSLGNVTSVVAVLTLNLATVDTTFNPKADGLLYRDVYSLVVQADRRILVGGRFTTLGGQARTNIGRLNADGALDTAFNPGASGGNFPVISLVEQVDGKILVGGSFTNLCGQTRYCIGRLNPDGSLDATFDPGVSSPGDPTFVSSLVLQPDGKILVGGLFTNLCGQTRYSIGRLNPDGSLDTSFDPKADGLVWSLALQPDGKILVGGGGFPSLGGQKCNWIGRVNSDGSLDATFKPRANDWVDSLAIQPDGKVLVGGDFTSLGGQTCNRIGRLNPDGSLDTSFNVGANDSVNTIAVQANGKILVGGWFTTLGGAAAQLHWPVQCRWQSGYHLQSGS